MAADHPSELDGLMKSAGLSHYMKTNATHIDMVRATRKQTEKASHPSPTCFTVVAFRGVADRFFSSSARPGLNADAHPASLFAGGRLCARGIPAPSRGGTRASEGSSRDPFARDAGHVVYPTSVESDTPTPSLGHTSKRGLFFSSGAFGACCFAQRRTGDPPRRVP